MGTQLHPTAGGGGEGTFAPRAWALPYLPWSTELSDVVLSCFTLSREIIFYGSSTQTTGRLAHAIVRGKLFIQCHRSGNLSVLDATLSRPTCVHTFRRTIVRVNNSVS